MKKKKMKKVLHRKKDNEELEQYFYFRKRSFKVPGKKGKGSYNRQKEKEQIKEW